MALIVMIMAFAASETLAQSIHRLDSGSMPWRLWWETSQDDYIAAYFQRGLESGQVWENPVADRRAAYQPAVVEALRKATRSRDTKVRAAAALALGRMRAIEALPDLARLAKDRSRDVRLSAVVGLALLDTPASREALGNPGDQLGEQDVIAWIAAMMLLHDPENQVVRVLGQLVEDDRSLHVQGMAAWALRVLRPEGYLDFLRPKFHDTTNELLASEIVLALGQDGSPDDLELLAQIAEERGRGGRIFILRRGRITRGIRVQGWWHPERMILRAVAGVAIEHYLLHNMTPDPGQEPSREMPYELEQRLQFIRGTARRMVPHVDRIWGRFYQYPYVAVRHLVGDSSDRQYVTELLHAEILRQRRPSPEGTSWSLEGARAEPIRGFVALAVGRRPGVVGPVAGSWEESEARHHERDVQRSIQMLDYGMRNRNEPVSFRAACAFSLGLTGDQQAIDALLAALPGFREDEQLIYGYGVLALALLDAPETLEAAAGFFGLDNQFDKQRLLERGVRDDLPLSRLMGARAAALGVALRQDERTVPMLVSHWGQNPWLSMELARAIGWSGGYAFSGTLIELLDQQEQPALAHLAARCLGEMFDPDRPSRLSRFVSNTYYRHWQGPTPQEGRLRERVIDRNVPGLSNPFLYHHVLPMHDHWDY